MLTIKELQEKALQYRREILSLIHHTGAGHTGGSLSVVDIINALYNRIMKIDSQSPESPERDYFILSKGHGAEAYYVILQDLGFFSRDTLYSLGERNSPLAGHPVNTVPGVEHNTGALGHGLSVAVGIALALKMEGRKNRVYCVLGDGELAEGSNWEAAMAAGHYALDNLTALIDRNGLQITGDTEKVMALEPLGDKWESFGWECREVNGHDYSELIKALEQRGGKPLCLIAQTVKGRGMASAEGDHIWHHRVPNEKELAAALDSLGGDGASRRKEYNE